MSAQATASGIQRTAKLIDNTVFDAFKTLTSERDAERLNGSLTLLHHLARTQDAEKHTKERDYTLTRLVRGLGASTLASRSGYFTTLVAFLGRPENADIGIERIIAVLDKQLHVGAAVADKEDSDALVGHALLVGALLRAGRLASAANGDLERCAQILVRVAGQKVFHASVAYKFLVDMLNEATVEQFTDAIWPAVRKDVARPWERHTCNTLHFLLVAQAKHPEIVSPAFLQKSLRTPELLTVGAHKHIGRIFWGNTSLAAITHPAYEALSKFLLSVKRKQLLAFWQGEVSETLAAPNKIKEVVTLKLLTDFLNETAEPLASKTLLALLTPRVIRMMVGSLKALKLQKHEVLVSFYEEFFDALQTYFGSPALAGDDAGRLAILLRFIVHPGTLLIEKYLPQKSVHQLCTKLGADAIRPLFAVYRSVFVGQAQKEPTEAGQPAVGWSQLERVHAAQMMQYLLTQKCVSADVEWRTEQLRFLLTVSLFHVNADGTEVVARKATDAPPSITRELSTTARSVFYASLQTRLPQLRDEKQLLLAIVEHVNGLVTKKNAAKLLRNGTEWTDETQRSWEQMFAVVQSGKNEKKLTLVFHVLFLHMGLQLFREAEMARLAIADLVQCMEKTRQAKKAQKRAKRQTEGERTDEEPEWIEVVVDLFLHLLSQNASFLRNLVNSLFPQLCGELTLSAVHQVLGMLDMKDGKNPLSAAGKDDEEADDGADEDDDEEDDEADEEVKSDGEDDDDEEDDEDDDDEDDDDDDVVEDDDEGTVTDQLRNAVSSALGSLLPAQRDDDADSVDLNEMGDDEAERLDAALSAAFQSIRKSSENGSAGGKSKKKTKAERTTNTTVMHFRIRVLDLIDIYLRTEPALAIALEILLALFDMIEYCSDSDLKPLADRVDRVLKRLLSLRQFGNVADVTAEQLAELLQSLVAKKVNPVKLSAHNQLLSKTVALLIAAAQLLPERQAADRVVRQLITEYTVEFVHSRNPRVPFSLLQDVFRVRWTGVWLVAAVLADEALAAPKHTAKATVAVRTFRRTQALELLALVYRNHGFIAGDADAFNASNEARVEPALAAYVARFAGAAATSETRVSVKEFTALVELLVEVQRTHQLAGVRPALEWPKIGADVQTIRKRVVLVALKPYRRLCQVLGLQALKNEPVANGRPLANGAADSDDEAHEQASAKAPQTNGKKAPKRKATAGKDDDDVELSAKDSKREKKLKKAERLRIASEGLDGLNYGGIADADEADSD